MLDRLIRRARRGSGRSGGRSSRVYVRMDFRAGGGAVARQSPAQEARPSADRHRAGHGIGRRDVRDPCRRVFPMLLVSATLLTTYGAINTVMLLLIDFTGLVVSPDDYGVLGHRPVSSRTYFAARPGEHPRLHRRL